MLPTPATDTAREALATIRRIADSPRTRRLDELEKLWKGEAWNDRPSFWDSTVPLNERGTCVQSSIAEASGGRLINLVFGNARFPSLEIGENAYGVEFSDDEKRALSKLAGAIVKQARLRPGMRQALEQGLMCGTLVAVGSLCMGRLRLQLLPAKYCEPTYGTDGALVSLEYRYRHDVMDDNGEPVTVWYRRVIDAKCDSVWDGVPTNPAGWLPDWREYTPKVVEHGLG